MTSPTLLVLAAGMGSRYGGLKQIDPMGPNGETILDYSVHDALRAGFGKVVFVIRDDFEAAFRESVGARCEDRLAVDYAFQRLEDLPAGFALPREREKPWGTAHAIRAARKVVDGPFAVINADDFYGREAYGQAAAYLAEDHPGECCLVGYHLANTLSEHGGVNRGVTTHEGGYLLNVEEIVEITRGKEGVSGLTGRGERRALDEQALVSMNFWGFSPGFFDQLEERFRMFLEARGNEPKAECYIPTVVDDLIRDGQTRCRVLSTNASWFGVTYPEDKPVVMETLAALVEQGEYPSPLV